MALSPRGNGCSSLSGDPRLRGTAAWIPEGNPARYLLCVHAEWRGGLGAEGAPSALNRPCSSWSGLDPAALGRTREESVCWDAQFSSLHVRNGTREAPESHPERQVGSKLHGSIIVDRLIWPYRSPAHPSPRKLDFSWASLHSHSARAAGLCPCPGPGSVCLLHAVSPERPSLC